MKTFKDLVFEERPAYYGKGETRAELYFDNGYGVSVITGASAYSNKDAPYELAIMWAGGIVRFTGITDDVLGWLTEEDVTTYMIKVQELPADDK